MPRYIALLRAVNVGGKNKISMANLREALTEAGYRNVQTLLQSGNVVLDAMPRSGVKLAEDLSEIVERELAPYKGESVKPDVIIRSPAELRQVIEQNPFQGETEEEPSLVAIMFTQDLPMTGDIERLRKSHQGAEKFRACGKHLYLYYPGGIGKSKFTGSLIERVLKTRGTARNWNTVLKLAALAATVEEEGA